MNKLQALREQIHLTQEELAATSGISVRTIQRIEAGAIPKGHTLKSLANALGVNEAVILETTKAKQTYDFTLIKLINLSTLLFFIPFGNTVIPLLIMFLKKQINPITKQLISIQFIWGLLTVVLVLLSAFVKKWFEISSQLTVVVMLICLLVNLFIIIRNTISLDKQQQLYFKLSFSIL